MKCVSFFSSSLTVKDTTSHCQSIIQFWFSHFLWYWSDICSGVKQSTVYSIVHFFQVFFFILLVYIISTIYIYLRKLVEYLAHLQSCWQKPFPSVCYTSTVIQKRWSKKKSKNCCHKYQNYNGNLQFQTHFLRRKIVHCFVLM